MLKSDESDQNGELGASANRRPSTMSKTTMQAEIKGRTSAGKVSTEVRPRKNMPKGRQDATTSELKIKPAGSEDFQNPKSFSSSELSKVGVRLLCQRPIILACEACGMRWNFRARPGEQFPPGYWQCPDRCNVPRPGCQQADQ